MENSMLERGTGTSAINSVRIDEAEFRNLPFDAKRNYLDGLLPTERVALILDDPDDTKLARALHPQELYWLFKEIDASDAMELLALANPQQCLFILDMELWKGWSFQEDKGIEYLGYILKGSEEHFLELLPHLDFNLLSLLLGRELIVAGGIGDLNTDEERQTDWDHTFDDVFLIKFKNPKHAQVIGSFLELVCRFDNSLYVALMESVSGEIDIESEEECYHIKSGRLADLGFPPLDEAREIYSRINPATFTPSCTKVLVQTGATTLPATFLSGSTLLERVILQMDSELFRMELNYLINTALVADQAHLVDTEYMKSVVERVYGYLNIALEHLSQGDVTKGVEIIRGEYLKSLFQLGFSIVLNLKFKAEKHTNDSNYANGKALSGLMSARPLYYRGFDADGIDGYREFREMQDVKTMAEFLIQ